MDNLTHTLAGMLVAEAVCSARRAEGRFRTAAYLTSALANNLPDIDPIYTWITKPRPLGSLLHHRGHTHTLILAIPAGFLLALAILKFLERNRDAFSSGDRRALLALGAVGPAIHIGMDFGNNYGVHPFWPFVSSWFYGDSIFIVEPLWWAVAIPALFFAISNRAVRSVLATVLVISLAAAVTLPFIARATVVALFVLAAMSAAASHFVGARARIAVAISACVAVAAVFVTFSYRAKASLRESAAEHFPSFRIVDVVVSPLPGNPLCWSALVVGTYVDRYRVLTANVAPMPSWFTARTCPADRDAAPSARMSSLGVPAEPALEWKKEYDADLNELRALARNDCRVAALVRFTRVPYVEHKPGGIFDFSPPFAGDLRYDRNPDLDFADMVLTPEHECPRFVPPWTPPRADILR